MKRVVNILLTVAIVVPVVLLFWPFVTWNNATIWDLLVDYASPFICCVLALIACVLIQKKK